MAAAHNKMIVYSWKRELSTIDLSFVCNPHKLGCNTLAPPYTFHNVKNNVHLKFTEQLRQFKHEHLKVDTEAVRRDNSIVRGFATSRTGFASAGKAIRNPSQFAPSVL